MPQRVTVCVSLKSYFGNADAAKWFARVAERLDTHRAVAEGGVEVFIIPTYLQIHDALRVFGSTPVRIGAQDVSPFDAGPFTGEVAASELQELGIAATVIGHAERRDRFGDTDRVVAAKTAIALRHDLTPVLCVGERQRSSTPDAAAEAVAQVRSALAEAPEGRIIVAYEPVWAIGAREPAGVRHIASVASAVRIALDSSPGRSGSSVIYGGSAGTGLLSELDTVDGLFLGRSAHNPDTLAAVVDEAASLWSRRS